MLKPSKKAAGLVDEFERSAAQAYWEEDQGWGKAVAYAQADRDADRAKLLKFIARLERRVAAAGGKA